MSTEMELRTHLSMQSVEEEEKHGVMTHQDSMQLTEDNEGKVLLSWRQDIYLNIGLLIAVGVAPGMGIYVGVRALEYFEETADCGCEAVDPVSIIAADLIADLLIVSFLSSALYDFKDFIADTSIWSKTMFVKWLFYGINRTVDFVNNKPFAGKILITIKAISGWLVVAAFIVSTVLTLICSLSDNGFDVNICYHSERCYIFLFRFIGIFDLGLMALKFCSDLAKNSVLASNNINAVRVGDAGFYNKSKDQDTDYNAMNAMNVYEI